MNDQPVIAVKNVSKKFRLFSTAKERLAEALHPLRKQYHKEFWALRDVSFEVGRGEIVGILGRNGSGKSTLLQIICGVMQASSGRVRVKGRISALLELGAGFNPEFTGRENVILNGAIHGFSRKQMLERMDEIEAFADIGEFFDQPIKLYSSGMFVRVAFAAAIHVEPEILVVDEALSVGDSKFQHRCFQRIRSFMEAGKTILVVSHSTDTLLRICDRGVVMDKGEMVLVGDIASAVNRYHQILFGTKSAAGNPPRAALSTVGSANTASADRPAKDGAPRSLDAGRTDRIASRPDYNAHENRMGSGKACIIDFDLVSDGVLNPSEIPTHSRCELIVKLRCDEDVTVSVGFAIVSLDGTYVSGTNLVMLEQPLIVLQAGQCVALKFHFQAAVAGGEYFLNLGCNEFVDGEDRFVDVRRSVARLKFAATPQSVGFVDLQVVPELIPLLAQEEGAVHAA
ncbi:ABC transporter ATP-binding protein [Herbaspirillum seropedicae]|uniref:ABC transporter ATP-binding protein n=1 Tax=Herbaspirillum seropedicae TaxID=964 RepID=UPI000847E87A|nr:ABC transporter ATP-binding protein [Herbaspirillum seropedicae]MDR6395712.1 lipopolysaccharide transport system ATP-binding protein [Herbaspirillum seropedicae]